MNDADLRSAVRRSLKKRHARRPDTLIVEELGIRHGAARIDIAVVNGMLHGYELKSDRDTLVRLPGQVRTYGAVLDRITLVAGERHLAAASVILPAWWGIVSATVGSRGSIRLRTVRANRPNPALDPFAIAKLLWREEALAILEELGGAVGIRSAPRTRIYGRLVESLSPAELRRRVREVLRGRLHWRTASF